LPAMDSSYVCFWSAFISLGEINFSRMSVSSYFFGLGGFAIHPIGDDGHIGHGMDTGQRCVEFRDATAKVG